MLVNRIHLLEPLLANQIGAGEVIERPASVVKELLENSLDAGASRIEIDIINGGLQLVRIRDNGVGIHQHDLSLAVSRHATSKVATLSDLEHLQSLGFRGEALASICSVSRFSLTSCTDSQDNGWQVKVEGRAMQPLLTPAAHPRGTTVEIADLFFNTPARRKFMRSEQTEWNSILELVKRAALSRFDVGFYLTHQQKNILQLRVADTEPARIRRLQEIGGANFARYSIALDTATQGISLWGWVGQPDEAPTQPNPQYFYVNGRMVRDKLLLHAVKQAYEGLLPAGRHPVYVLYLDIEPGAVDVNVHPAKHEVRFQESRLVHDFIFSRINKAIAGEAQQHFHPSSYASEPVHHVAEQMALYNAMHGATIEAVASPSPDTIKKPALGIPLGQMHARYLLLQQPAGLGIINVEKAYELLIYQSLTQTMNSEMQLLSQPLLIPTVISVTEAVSAAVEANQQLLRQCGFDLSALGEKQIVLRALPATFRNTDTNVLLENLLATLTRPVSAITVEDILSTLATCYFTAEKRLESKEIDELLDKLSEAQAIRQQCIAELSLNDLGMLFVETQ